MGKLFTRFMLLKDSSSSSSSSSSSGKFMSAEGC
jgi:hypothetical protein